MALFYLVFWVAFCEEQFATEHVPWPAVGIGGPESSGKTRNRLLADPAVEAPILRAADISPLLDHVSTSAKAPGYPPNTQGSSFARPPTFFIIQLRFVYRQPGSKRLPGQRDVFHYHGDRLSAHQPKSRILSMTWALLTCSSTQISTRSFPRTPVLEVPVQGLGLCQASPTAGATARGGLHRLIQNQPF